MYKGRELSELNEREAACEIGFVMQNPEQQIVTDKVWHELAFGLENMGMETNEIRRRVGEMASYFGIADWFHSDTDKLSGGQKQILNLASVMAMQPNVLLLDEPTSQLDPVAASEFIMTLQRLNRELGLTILLIEHRLEDVFSLANKVLVMENGALIFYDGPRTVGERLMREKDSHPIHCGLPSALRIYRALGIEAQCPLTVRDGRRFLTEHFLPEREAVLPPDNPKTETVLEMKNVWFRYEKICATYCAAFPCVFPVGKAISFWEVTQREKQPRCIAPRGCKGHTGEKSVCWKKETNRKKRCTASAGSGDSVCTGYGKRGFSGSLLISKASGEGMGRAD